MTGVQPPLRLVLVDDHRLFRESLGALLEVHEGIEVVAEVDQPRRLSDARHRGEHGDDQREAPARPAAHQLDHLAARQAAVEQAVEGGMGSGERLALLLFLPPVPHQLPAAADAGRR